MGQSSPHQGNQEAQSYYIPRRGTTGPLAKGANGHHLPLVLMCSTFLVFLLPLLVILLTYFCGILLHPHTSRSPSCPCHLVFRLRTISFRITVAVSSSLSNFQFQPHIPHSLPDFLGCPTTWPQMRHGGREVPASPSNSTAELASIFLLLILSECPRAFWWVVSMG